MNKLHHRKFELANYGERLVPGYSSDEAEVIRHKSTYQLFLNIIIQDIITYPQMLEQEIKVLDIGCGTGHGTFMLVQIPNCKIYGTDISKESISFAKENYNHKKIEYRAVSANQLINMNIDFDYIVSRHALEHIEDGLNIGLDLNFKKRIMLSVPYMEKEGNQHHVMFNINEESFNKYVNTEFIYEDLQGVNDVNLFATEYTNSVTCISSKPAMKRLSEILEFPQPAYQLNGLEKLFFPLQKKYFEMDATLISKIGLIKLEITVKRKLRRIRAKFI